MEALISHISLQVNSKLYLKNPESSDLGKKIIIGSIDLIDSEGYEEFTFKKLGKVIHSSEASIYRYFENKHNLLLYITWWYWAYHEYELVLSTTNISNPETRLKIAIEKLVSLKTDVRVSDIYDLAKLERIVISESSKSFLVKRVDELNSSLHAYAGYKNLVARVSQIILEINPSFKYPNMLVSTLIEGAHLQRYFAIHLPKLTNTIEGEDSIETFYKRMVFSTIKST